MWRMDEDAPLHMGLVYGNMQEAEAAIKILEQVYPAGSIEIDHKCYQPSWWNDE